MVDEEGSEFGFGLFTDVDSTTVTVNLPDAEDSAMQDYVFEVEVWTNYPQGAESGDEPQNCNRRTSTTPSSMSFEFLAVPEIEEPEDGDTLTLAQLAALEVEVEENSDGGLGNNGLNVFDLQAEAFSADPDLPSGISLVVWTIFSSPFPILVPHVVP